MLSILLFISIVSIVINVFSYIESRKSIKEDLAIMEKNRKELKEHVTHGKSIKKTNRK